MSFSIKRRLLVGLLSVSAVICVIASVKSYFETRHEIEELFDAQIVQSARSLLALSSHELYEQLAYLDEQSKDPAANESKPIQIHKYEQSMDFQIWLMGSHLAVRSESAPNSPFTRKEKTFSDINLNGSQLRVYALSNEDNTIQVQVAENYAERDRLSNSISMRLMGSLSVMLPLLGILISVMVTRTMEPLNRIAREIESRTGDDLQPVNDNDIPDEAKPMITALNHLFERLQVAFENISRFTADAAHELRTPLASLRVNTQVALNAKEEHMRNDALNDVISSVDHATVLVEQLLVLSRLDPESGLYKNEHTDLKNLTEHIVAQQATDAIKADIDIGLDAKAPTYVFGKSGMISILIRNLIENAIHHTPEHGVIDISLNMENDKVKLSVADSGPGIPAHEREDVFRRFYRIKGNDKPGTGLGLSIVQRIVELHQAQIALGKSKLGGLQVDVWFEAAETAVDVKNKSVMNKHIAMAAQ